MKRFLLLLTTILLTNCSPQTQNTASRELLTTTVKFTPPSRVVKLGDNVELSIVPIDATKLDSITVAAANTDGVYDDFKETVTLDEMDASTSSRKKSKSFYTKLFERLEDQVSSGKLSSQIVKYFKAQIVTKNRIGLSGREPDAINRHSNIFNPYFLNKRYLGVFEVFFNSNSKKIFRVSLDSVMVISGFTQMRPLSTSYYEKMYTASPGSIEQMKNLQRFNMQDLTIIPPQSKILKYFAIPSIDQNVDKLQVKVIRGSEVYDFPFEVTVKSSTTTVKIEEFKFTDEKYNGAGRVEYVLFKIGQHIIPVKEGRLFLPRSLQDSNVTVYSLTMDPTYDRYRIGMLKDTKMVSFKKKHGQVNLVYGPWVDLN